MIFTEPATLLTDYALGVLTAVLGVRLVRRGGALRQTAVTLWGTSFLVTSVGAICGGTYHGFTSQLGAWGSAALWKTSVYAIGLGSVLLVFATLVATISPPLRFWLLAVALVKAVFYAAWMTTHDDFKYVIYAYVSDMLAVLLLHGWRGLREKEKDARWIVAGMGVSFLGAAVQQSGGGLHRHFNHNDLYHTIQALGFVFLHKGGCFLRDR